MFTKQQLNLLIRVQAGDDWTPNGFLHQLVSEGRESDISDAEFNELMALLDRFTYEQVRDLQIALTILDNFPK